MIEVTTAIKMTIDSVWLLNFCTKEGQSHFPVIAQNPSSELNQRKSQTDLNEGISIK